MKFILNEKFNLNERFSLLEDDTNTPETEVYHIDGLSASLQAGIEALQQYKQNNEDLAKAKADLEQLEQSREAFANRISSMGGLDNIKRAINDYVKKLVDMLQPEENSDLDTSIQLLQTDLNRVASSDNAVNDANENTIKTEFKAFSDLASGVITSKLTEISDSLDANYSGEKQDEAQKAVEAVNTEIQKVGDAIKIPAADAAKYATVAETLNNFGAAVEGFTATPTAENLDAILTVYHSLDAKNENGESTGSFIDSLQTLIDKAVTANRQANSNAASLMNKDDWAKLINDAPASEKAEVWEQYYETVWKSDAEKIKELGEPLRLELLTLGFDEVENPFITYIKICFANDVTPNRVSYGLVHNAYISQQLTSDDLRGHGTLTTANIIFCADLHSKAADEINDYLRNQARFLTESGKQTAINAKYISAGIERKLCIPSKDKDGNDVVTIKPESRQAFFCELFYAAGNLAAGEAPIASGAFDTYRAALKSITSLRDTMTLLFGKATEKIKLTPGSYDQVLKQLSGISKDACTELMKYLILKHSTMDTVEKLFAKYKITNQTIDTKVISPYVKKIEAFDVNKDNLLELLDQLAELAKVNS